MGPGRPSLLCEDRGRLAVGCPGSVSASQGVGARTSPAGLVPADAQQCPSHTQCGWAGECPWAWSGGLGRWALRLARRLPASRESCRQSEYWPLCEKDPVSSRAAERQTAEGRLKPAARNNGRGDSLSGRAVLKAAFPACLRLCKGLTKIPDRP